MSRAGRVIAAVGAAAAAGGGVGRLLVAAPRYRGPVSDHFDGRRFLNSNRELRQDGSFLKWQLTKEGGFFPDWIDAPPGPAPPARVGEGRMRVTFINHATLLVQFRVVNILTDPIWSDRTSPVTFV